MHVSKTPTTDFCPPYCTVCKPHALTTTADLPIGSDVGSPGPMSAPTLPVAVDADTITDREHAQSAPVELKPLLKAGASPASPEHQHKQEHRGGEGAVETEDVLIDEELVFFLACGVRDVAYNMRMAPYAHTSDGLMDCVVVRRRNASGEGANAGLVVVGKK